MIPSIFCRNQFNTIALSSNDFMVVDLIMKTVQVLWRNVKEIVTPPNREFEEALNSI